MPRLASTIPWPALAALILLAALALLIYAAIPQPAAASNHWTDYDTDDDGLIDITTIAQLQGVRFDHDGNGWVWTGAGWSPGSNLHRPNYNLAFPNRQTTTSATATGTRMGCPGVCRGYELMNNLDFATATTSLRNWTPGPFPYEGIFEGNGYTISNLNVSQNSDAGLFRVVANAGIVRNLGLINPVVSGRQNVGTLVGENRGTIAASYATGGTSTIGATGVATDIGGLVGENSGTITASYARVSVSGSSGNTFCFAGGLVGAINGGKVIASYGAGTTTCASTASIALRPVGPPPGWAYDTSGDITGGLAGLITDTADLTASVTDSYCDNEADGLTDPCIPVRLLFDGGWYVLNFVKPPGYTTAQFQAPTGYTGIYANWNVDLDGDTFPDNPWNFGSATTYPAHTTIAQREMVTDYDSDNDNLIDISNLHQLNAVRHDLNGDGLPGAVANYPAYAGAFPGGALVSATPTVARMGCPQTCAGYELMDNLDFAADNTAVTTTDAYPDWTPIGAAAGPYAATFDGKGYTISRLTIDAAIGNSGLFDTIGGDGVIRDVGLIDASIANASSSAYVGILAADNDGGTIAASYAGGGSVTITGTSTVAGGLLGRNAGALRAVYATASVSSGTTSSSTAGGLIGLHTGSVAASYATGAVAGTGAGAVLGGLIGQASSTAAAAANSYCDTQTTTQTDCVGNETDSADLTVDGKTTSELQTPVSYTGIYALWNVDVTGDAFPDNPWNFGTTTTYPVLNTPAQRTVDHDANDNNLIDIDTLDQLNAIRHDLNGDGLPDATTTYAAYVHAFLGGALVSATPTAARMGCPATCLGYELTADLDFAADGATVTSTDAYPDWMPIGNADGYTATFDGKGYTITRLTIAAATGNAGLFHTIGNSGIIRDVGMIDASITSEGADAYVGVLAGNNDGGTITASYAVGGSVTISGADAIAGGLLGRNAGALRAVYAATPVSAGATASSAAGGLIGLHTGSVTASYAAGAVSGTGAGAHRGGLIGQASSTAAAATDSYCDTDATTQADCIGNLAAGAAATATGYTTMQLQEPTGYTGIYANWNIDLTGGNTPSYPWYFGTTTTRPTLNTPTQRQAQRTGEAPPPGNGDGPGDGGNGDGDGSPGDGGNGDGDGSPGDGGNGNGGPGNGGNGGSGNGGAPAGDDVPPPALPRTIQPEPDKPYDPAADHPEIYANAEYQITATCETRNPDPETGNPQAATITFNLGAYEGPILLVLSIWTSGRYMAYETQDIAQPALDRTGQTARLQVDTDPAETRFRLDGSRNGLRANLVLGYANCRSD